MKTQAFRYTLILLSGLTLSTFAPVADAQIQDFSMLNLPDGAIVRLGKGGVSFGDRGIAFSPDGSRLAVATSIGIWLYDAETLSEIALLAGHNEKVSTVAFSPDGKKLASGSGSQLPGTLKLWDVESGQNIVAFHVERSSVVSAAFSPDGAKLAWAGRLWDVATGQQLDIIQDKGLFKLEFSSDGVMLAGTSISAVNGKRAGIVKLYDIETGQLLKTLNQGTERVSSIAFSPDGHLLASGSAVDGTVNLWDVDSGQNTAVFTVKPNDGVAMCVAFSPDGAKLAVASAAGITLLEVSTGQHLYTRQHVEIGKLEISVDVFSVAFSPDGTKLASASWDGVKLWDAAAGQNIAALPGHARAVNAVAFAPDGLTLASNSISGVQVWEVAAGQHIATLAGPPNFAASFAYSPDGTRLAAGSADARNAEHTVKIWDVDTGKNTYTLQGHSDLVTAVAYSQDGTLLAAGSKDRTINVWDVKTGQSAARLQGHESSINAVAFSPDGTKLASGADDTSIRLWEIPNGKTLHTLGGVNSPQTPAKVLPAPRRGEDINEVQMDSDGDVEPEIIRGSVRSVAFSPDGTKLASASMDGVRLWHVGRGQLLGALTDGEASPGFSVAFSPDGAKLASGSWDDTAKLWDVSTQKHIAAFRGHTGNVWTVAFSPDGTKLASGSDDGTVLLWNAPE